MSKTPRKLRLAYTVDPEPVNGWVLARCPALDLVSQGATAQQARETLLEEAHLLLAEAQSNGGLAPLVERLAGDATQHPAAPGGDALDIDLAQLA